MEGGSAREGRCWEQQTGGNLGALKIIIAGFYCHPIETQDGRGDISEPGTLER